jgi:hypothetical protein
MSGPIITYVQHSNTAPQSELSALAAVYRIVLTAKKPGCLLDKTGPDDAKLRSTKGVSDVEQPR